jgi:adenosyl cobinamide kinase/adenosyl cobinamide phosphate guanylyltransferase
MVMAGCYLCLHLSSEHPVLDEIINYVSDNAHRIHINELAAHVKTALYEQLQVDMTQEQIRHHFLAHQCEQKLVLNHVLRDLVDIIGVAKSNCVVVSEETGMQSMDPKNTGVYIDAVKQIMSIYKQLESSRVRN